MLQNATNQSTDNLSIEEDHKLLKSNKVKMDEATNDEHKEDDIGNTSNYGAHFENCRLFY